MQFYPKKLSIAVRYFHFDRQKLPNRVNLEKSLTFAKRSFQNVIK